MTEKNKEMVSLQAELIRTLGVINKDKGIAQRGEGVRMREEKSP